MHFFLQFFLHSSCFCCDFFPWPCNIKYSVHLNIRCKVINILTIPSYVHAEIYIVAVNGANWFEIRKSKWLDFLHLKFSRWNSTEPIKYRTLYSRWKHWCETTHQQKNGIYKLYKTNIHKKRTDTNHQNLSALYVSYTIKMCNEHIEAFVWESHVPLIIII